MHINDIENILLRPHLLQNGFLNNVYRYVHPQNHKSTIIFSLKQI